MRNLKAEVENLINWAILCLVCCYGLPDNRKLSKSLAFQRKPFQIYPKYGTSTNFIKKSYILGIWVFMEVINSNKNKAMTAHIQGMGSIVKGIDYFTEKLL